jgi:hypothetical protein
MNQRCGLKRLSRLLQHQLLRVQFSEFDINHRQQLLGGARIALLHCGQDVGNLTQRQTQGAGPDWIQPSMTA